MVQEKGLRVEHLGETREVTLEVFLSGFRPTERYYLVMFERATLLQRRRRGLRVVSPKLNQHPRRRKTAADRVERLERELADARDISAPNGKTMRPPSRNSALQTRR